MVKGSDVITGSHAKSYDHRQPLIKFVNNKHIGFLSLKNGDKVLDVGCGTAEVIRKLYVTHGDTVSFHGIDPSDELIKIARSKFNKNIKNIKLQIGYADQLPYENNYFDWVISSLTFHHMSIDTKLSSLREMYRVLKPSGMLLITDWGKPTNILASIIVKIWSHHAYVKDNSSGILIELIKKSRFKHIKILSIQGGFIYHILTYK